MRTRLVGACLLAIVLALVAAACSSNAPAPAPTAPTSTASTSDALPPVWDADPRSGALPGGLDGEVLFATETAAEPLRLEGVVRAIRGTCPNIGLRIGDHVVRTFARTAFEGQRCAAIAVRDRIVVVTRPLGDDLMGALRVTTRKP
jgi:hypothetical protein